VRDEQARQPDQHAADADDPELDALAHQLPSPVSAERPQPVADPIEDDRQRGRDDLRDQRALVHLLGAEERVDQQVEDAEVDDEPDRAHDAEARELPDQRAHAPCPPQLDGLDRLGTGGFIL